MSWYDGDADAPRRLFKLSFLSGLFLSAPLIIGTLWYAWSSFAAMERFRRALEPKAPMTAELFHIGLHDEIARDLRALTIRERPAVGQLPTYELSLSGADLDALDDQLAAPSRSKAYVKGLLRSGGAVHEVEVRYRGEQPWHALAAQKSFKIRADRGDLVDGVRVFNLLNDPTPFGLEDQIILDIARESDLLTPNYRPVRLRLNNHDLGVYRLESQPDESLIREGHRIPGNLYTGDAEKLPGDERIGPLFTSTVGWTKTTQRSEEHPDDSPELWRFVAAVREASHLDFARYAEASLDLDRYAAFDALDVVFGGNEHDFLSNHRFYADPYRGKLEPVAWSFRGFSRDLSFNDVDHPLLIRLKLTPGYLARRDRAVYALLTGKASVPAIHDRAERWVSALTEELAADPYWDAYKLLPRASKLHRSLSRPMSFDRWILATQYELDGFGQRSRYLLDALEEPDLSVRSTTAGPDRLAVDVTVRGHAAYAVEELRAQGACAGRYRLFADADLDGRLDPAVDPLIAERPLGQSAAPRAFAALVSRARLVPRADANAKRGWVRVEQEPTRYTYFVEGHGCAPTAVVLVLRSAVTDASLRVEARPGGATDVVDDAPSAAREPAIEEVPTFVAGERGAHPWRFPQPAEDRKITLGPGRLEVATTRRFGAHEAVDIAPGTTLLMGPGASLVFGGPVSAVGTGEQPIVVRRLDPARAFGGLALQGPATAGSRLEEVRVDGGSRPLGETVEYTAPLSVHDTHDVTLSAVTITDTRDADDVIHAYKVRGLALHEVEIERAPIDGVDLEFVTADLRGVRIIGAGDDGLDLMGSTLRVQDSLLSGCKNNGISAGEETDVTATSVVVADTKVGVLAKNASSVRLVRSLVYRTERGLRARKKETRYGGPSRIGASDSFVVEAQTVQDRDKGSTIDVDRLRTDIPGPGELPHLLEQVLRARAWAEAEVALDALRERGGGH